MRYLEKFMLLFKQPNQVEFTQKMFFHNNFVILLLSIFLFCEQLIYGLVVVGFESTIGKIHLLTSLIMFFYAMISFYIKKLNPDNITTFLSTYAISFGLVGFIIAILRSLIEVSSLFVIPTVYIAVLYGFAMAFYFNPLTMLLIYFVSSSILIILLPFHKPHVSELNYMQDIIANNIIAWIISIVNYQRFIKVCSNEIALREMNHKLKYLSSTDVLTKIYNRRKLEEMMIEFIRETEIRGGCFSVILVDIDHFKSINDSYGHAQGDRVLQKLVRLISGNLRKNDVIGRWGGEEFLIICPETCLQEAYHVAEKIRVIIENHSFIRSKKITGSFGVASYESGDSVHSIVNKADQAMYYAKEMGRNVVKQSIR
ncbi:diguanylate cyclase (GGDEF) domain-containing protein [Tindallia magadiensis]|uniref:Diguanylate cyclase (GGDEF) domain-containing protein n=1 Tax=Tindallia magadiensis TaxID=69895 RepID=A0A1I3ADF1_9FIRM|nr:GGDEF domain-containing protein [Tindallia magadiensis]SFH47995.1 diguanylate cyclase (GGDEF) domain-containing protein [Tindallia magadiensis]